MQTKSTKTKETNVYGNYVTPHTFAAFKAITHINAQMKRKGHKEAINQDRRERENNAGFSRNNHQTVFIDINFFHRVYASIPEGADKEWVAKTKQRNQEQKEEKTERKRCEE